MEYKYLMSFILFLLFANELSSKNNQTVFDKSKSLKENTLKNDTNVILKKKHEKILAEKDLNSTSKNRPISRDEYLKDFSDELFKTKTKRRIDVDKRIKHMDSIKTEMNDYIRSLKLAKSSLSKATEEKSNTSNKSNEVIISKEVKPKEIKPKEVKSEEVKSEEVKFEEVKSEEVKSNNKSEVVKSRENKSEEIISKESKLKENISDDDRLAKMTITKDTDFKSIFQKAKSKLLDEDYEFALALFNECIKRKYYDIQSIYLKGLTLRKMKRYEEAIKTFNNLFILDQTLYVTFFEIGKIHLENKEYESALHYFDKYIAENPSSHEAFYCKALAYFDTKKEKQALEFINKAIKGFTQNPEYFILSGKINLFLKSNTVACNEFKKALKLDSELIIEEYNEFCIKN